MKKYNQVLIPHGLHEDDLTKYLDGKKTGYGEILLTAKNLASSCETVTTE